MCCRHCHKHGILCCYLRAPSSTGLLGFIFLHFFGKCLLCIGIILDHTKVLKCYPLFLKDQYYAIIPINRHYLIKLIYLICIRYSLNEIITVIGILVRNQFVLTVIYFRYYLSEMIIIFLNTLLFLQFNLTPVAMGLMFVISGGTYACIAPIIGRICDRWAYPKRVISVGCLLIVTSYSLVGPAPFLPLPK